MTQEQSNGRRIAGIAAVMLALTAGAWGVARVRRGADGGAPAADAAAPCAAGSAAACAMQGSAGRGGGTASWIAGQPRLVEFSSGACAACERMAPIVAQVERRCLAEADGSLVHVNVDEPEGEALAERYGVRALPTFVGIDAQGAEVMRVVGLQTPEALAAALGEVRGRACPPIL